MELLTTRKFNGVELNCYKAENKDDDFWVTREQIGQLLEYAEPMKAIAKIHERNKERLDKFSTVVKLTQVEGNRTVTRDMIVYNFRGFLEVCRNSEQPKANTVMDFAWSIMNEIRRNGYYGTTAELMRVKVQERANEIEAAKLLQDMIKTPAYGLSESDKRKITRELALKLAGINVLIEEAPKKIKRRRRRYTETDPELIDFRTPSEISEAPYDLINA